ncbi:hypothetical protein MBAV_001569 [Candidatus Magnetobacterium bavaricum]|uniref:Transcriptional regulator n=1 Tax=Candidatus Magnetobacterium bavaricum TaxID=29290 RepID=A0A0F3GWF0_9BACT|nr:hypothetical protein MBAV_001569 [Candidatus Magnetobacterium bavaricum]
MLSDFVRVGKAIECGEDVSVEKGVYFTSFEAFGKALTPRRLELMHIIKALEIDTISELATAADRDITEVTEDVQYLERIGLIEVRRDGNRKLPYISYDKIVLEIAV